MGKISACLSVIVYIWIFGSCLLCSASTNPSLWGQKVAFLGRSCYWRLSKTCTVPPLEELSVCVDLWRQITTSAWTAFIYKKPGELGIELGLAGKGGNLKAWLFGNEWTVAYDLPLQNWHTVCLTWSNHTRRFQLIVNGSVGLSSKLNDLAPSTLAPNGTLTLGVSHSFVGGIMNFETGTNFMGEITMFRMWQQELNPQQLAEWKCVSGNVVTWSKNDWEYQGCSPITDNRLKCEWSKYRINMKLSITQKASGDLNGNESKAIVLKWLETILPQNTLVNSLFLSSLSQKYQTNCALCDHENAEMKEARNASSKEEWFSCVVYVTVSPHATIDETQDELWTLLIHTYNHSDHTVLQTDPASLNILPVAIIPENDPNYTDFSDTFYRVYMNLTMNGSVESAAQTLQHWLQQTLGGGHRMTVLNFKLTTNPNQNGRSKSALDSRYGCTFHVQAFAPVNVNETRTLIFDLLTKGFSNSSIAINVSANQISILHIEPGFCPEDTTQTVYGLYTWPSIPAQDTYEMKCEKGHDSATRLCKLDGSTDGVIWDPPDISRCEKVMIDIDDLEGITVMPNNSADVLGMIENLLRNETDLNLSQLNTVLKKLSEVTEVGIMTSQLADSIISVVSNVLDSTSFLAQTTNKILSITERVGNRIDFSGFCHNTTVPSLALQLINVETEEFQGLTFGVSSFQTGLSPEIFLNQAFAESSPRGSVASISLPHTLDSFFPQNNQNMSRIQFHFYGTESLFEDPSSSLALNSYVLSASVTNATVNDLKDPVVVTLLHLQPKEDYSTVQCVYWDLEKNNGKGGWDDNGCQVKHTNFTHTSCICFHLTHFGVLLDVSKTPINPKDDMILTIITYLGCGISSVFLGITLLTYIAFGKLRGDYPSKILMNLSGALLGLNMCFLLNSWLAEFNNDGLCIAVAAILHYFLLASFTWMGLEAINMYLAFVKVFNVYVPSYILKFCLLGWGLPLMIVSIVLAADKDCYGSAASVMTVNSTSPFCWVQNDTAFFVTVVAFVVLILLSNICVFGLVLAQIRGLHLSKAAGMNRGMLHDLRVVASLTFLLGLTWILAFFAWGPAQVPLLYLFSALNSLQGFFIFLFHCLMKDNVRKQWRIHLCCGKFKLTDYSAWSGSVTVGGRAKSGKLVHTPSETTSERKISDSSGNGGDKAKERDNGAG
ncbi:adhesion G-protein coupled receptor G4 isoform X1 [Pygocentrus nattereri]|uniref:adhesion G-protein coupled receptor G4 isoform X1 n=1 Tax=Pygocentrus nattereri TaxID=42514 RepID=UPI001890FE3C|nr:adhesion G-protein coupled receptor G4 isoform X1 [Pygocentrus nattereri]XP_037396212.1 adhesion G-protein coupled receptor G4 isoform X1 [Pygocentrus nattereri]